MQILMYMVGQFFNVFIHDLMYDDVVLYEIVSLIYDMFCSS